MTDLTPDTTGLELDAQQTEARSWFEDLRSRICAEFEAIEREAGSNASFDYLAWNREDEGGELCGAAHGDGDGSIQLTFEREPAESKTKGKEV